MSSHRHRQNRTVPPAERSSDSLRTVQAPFVDVPEPSVPPRATSVSHVPNGPRRSIRPPPVVIEPAVPALRWDSLRPPPLNTSPHPLRRKISTRVRVPGSPDVTHEPVSQIMMDMNAATRAAEYIHHVIKFSPDKLSPGAIVPSVEESNETQAAYSAHGREFSRDALHLFGRESLPEDVVRMQMGEGTVGASPKGRKPSNKQKPMESSIRLRPSPNRLHRSNTGRTLNAAEATRGHTGRRQMLRPSDTEEEVVCMVWPLVAQAATFCWFDAILVRCGMPDRNVRQAWREKVTLCLIILSVCFFVGFFTFGFQRLVCPPDQNVVNQTVQNWLTDELDSSGNPTGRKSIQMRDDVVVYGILHNFEQMQALLLSQAGINLTSSYKGSDLSNLFRYLDDPWYVPAGYLSAGINPLDCTVTNPHGDGSIGTVNKCLNVNILTSVTKSGGLLFQWDDIAANNKAPHTLLVYDNKVLNLTSYFATTALSSSTTAFLRQNLGRDMSHGVVADLSQDGIGTSIACLTSRTTVGFVAGKTFGCMISDIVMWFGLVMILGLVFSKFLIATDLGIPWSNNSTLRSNSKMRPFSPRPPSAKSFSGLVLTNEEQAIVRTLTEIAGAEATVLGPDDGLYTICMITCYSEGEQGLRTTLDSVSLTTYNDRKKLIFVVADGLVTGSGETRSTPDIVLSLMEEDISFGIPEPKSYIAVADGEKQHNMATVHCGYYRPAGREDRATPMVLVAKCGTEKERTAREVKKPGNRGKRDSQLIVMNFLSRVCFDDRMTELDYDLFSKITHVAGVTPDAYELILMVDADTRVLPDALTHMVHAMMNDTRIVGLCGETRIDNKAATWVTAIQVVALELVGTVSLPAAICFTLYLVTSTFVTANPQIIPLIMLAAILGLPAVLIVFTSRHYMYILWMLVYLLALPIWNFVLPVYAYWHFDDFSWGATRVVVGETGGGNPGHGEKEGTFEAGAVRMQK
ncbi:hypothetical protein HDU93_002641, partial [Gonapodya sp. JEL0774]